MRLLTYNVSLVLSLLISGYVSCEGQGTKIDFNTIPKSGTILVYAHLDDDLIWMLPFWSKTEKFIGGGMPATPAYRTIISQQQTFMNNNGYNISYQPNWYTPWDDITNTEYSQFYLGANSSYNYLLNDHLEPRLFNNTTELSRYEINKIKAKLEQYFADPSMSRVITHNNWGEYGHQHHRAVNKAVRELAVKYGKDVWILGCDNGGFVDVTVPNGITWAYGSFNTPNLYTGIRTIYINNGAWTWYTDIVPSGDHKFIKIVDGGNDKSNILKGDAITYPGPSQLEAGAYIFDGDDDYMTLKGNNNSSFTIAMRVRPDLIKEMDISAMEEYPLSTKNDRNIYLTGDGHIRARIFDGSSNVITSSAVLSVGTWTHISITGNGTSFKLYINGVLDKNITSGTAITNYTTPEFVIGQSTQTGAYFKGQVNNVNLYSRALSDNEIAQLSGRGYTITSGAGTGGTINPSGSVVVRAGSEISFSIKANSGYQIADVTVDNSSVGAVSSYRFSNIYDNHRISASFRLLTYTINVDAGPGGKISPGGEVVVNYGAKQKFTIYPDNGFMISDVKVDNVSVGPVSEYTFNDISSNHTISANFTLITYNIESVSGLNGTISPSGRFRPSHGTDLTFTIEANNGYQVDYVKVDNETLGPLSKYTFTNINSDHTISVTFKPILLNVTSSSGKGGLIDPSGTTVIKYGDDLSYTIMPDKGYQIKDVLVDDVSEGIISNFTFNDIKADHKISAAFMPMTFTLKVIAGEGGYVSPAEQVSINYGEDQHYTIIPDYGYRLNQILLDNAPVNITSNDFTIFNVNQNHSLIVTFSKLITYMISSRAGSNGSITPSGDTLVFEGSDHSYTITPFPGFRIENVFIDTLSLKPVSDYTFKNISADHTISATFSSDIAINIYPNPFRNEFKIKIESPYENYFDMSVIDITGKVVYSHTKIPGNTITPVILELPPGEYNMVLYFNGKRIGTSKVIRN